MAVTSQRSILGKYNILLDAQHIADTLVNATQGYDGRRSVDVPNDWNKSCSSTWIRSSNNKLICKFRLRAIRKIDTLEEAWNELAKVQDALKMMIAIKMCEINHAVSGDIVLHSSPISIRATNTWDTARPICTVDKRTFRYAVLFEYVS